MCQLGKTEILFLNVKTAHVFMINNSGGEGETTHTWVFGETKFPTVWLNLNSRFACAECSSWEKTPLGNKKILL